MLRSRALTYATPLALLAVALLAGCADPAADKPRAQVADAGEVPMGSEGAEVWVISDASEIGFTGSKVTGSHEGGFNDFDGRILLVNGDPTQSSVELTIAAESLWADNDRLTGHLKSPDFFEVETYPEARFVSTSIEQRDGQYLVTGNLTLHGVTKSVAFPAAIQVGEEEITANAEFSIRRFDFEMEYPGKADDLIRDDVVVRFDLVAVPEGEEMMMGGEQGQAEGA